MPLKSMVRLVSTAIMVLLPAGSALAQTGVGFAMVGIAAGQSASVNALNMGSRTSTQDSSCSVNLQFVDSQGQVLKQSVVELRPGKGGSLDLSRDQVPGDGLRVQIRAVLVFGAVGGAAPGPGARRQFDCNIVPSFELYDTKSGKSSVVMTDAKPLPTPDPRSIARLESHQDELLAPRH